MAPSKRARVPRRTHKRNSPVQSNTGIIPLINVNDENSAENTANMMAKGPMLIFVVAAWCPHCVTFMPKLVQAALGPRTVNVAMVESEHLPTLNAALEKRNNHPETINVQSYPSGFAVTPELTKPNSASPTTISTEINNVKQYMQVANKSGKVGEATSSKEGNGEATASPSEVANEEVTASEVAKGEGAVRSTTSPKLPQSPADFTATRSAHGGGLLTAMSHTAYTLAPTAVLLATAAAIMKGSRKSRKGRKAKSARRKTRRALRNRR